MAVKQMAALKYYVIWSHDTVYVKLFEKSETTSDKRQFSNVSNFYLPLHTLYLPLSVSAWYFVSMRQTEACWATAADQKLILMPF